MIESFLTQNKIVAGETAIGDYLETGQSDYSKIWRESYGEMVQDFIDQGFITRLLCKRLSLQAAVTKTAAFDGAISSRDYAQRVRVVISVSAITGSAIFTLQGTDDGTEDSPTYEDVYLIGDDSASATTKTITTAAIGDNANTYLITRPYKQYRLRLISIGTTVTYSAYMIEEVYTNLHRDKARAHIYRSLMATQDDVWEEKYTRYRNDYQERLNSGRFYYDADDDDTLEEAESQIDVQNEVRFRP